MVDQINDFCPASHVPWYPLCLWAYFSMINSHHTNAVIRTRLGTPNLTMTPQALGLNHRKMEFLTDLWACSTSHTQPASTNGFTCETLMLTNVTMGLHQRAAPPDQEEVWITSCMQRSHPNVLFDGFGGHDGLQTRITALNYPRGIWRLSVLTIIINNIQPSWEPMKYLLTTHCLYPRSKIYRLELPMLPNMNGTNHNCEPVVNCKR